jgi:tetratricopeptide (TPR) repeat protein
LPEDLAGAYRIRSSSALEAGDYALAQSSAEEANLIAKTRLPPRHNQSVLALIDLCYAQLLRGDPGARQTGEHALAHALESYGGSYTHANVLKARVARAQTLAANGELDLAIDETSRAIKDEAALFSPSARVIGSDLLRLSRLQLRAGQIPSALGSAERAQAILAECLDRSSAGYASVMEVRGSALLATGRFREALADLNLAEKLFRDSFGPAYPSAASIRELRVAALAAER